MSPRVIAMANQKGGVGKTTTAVSLCAELAQTGYRTLLVDLDPQGNASTGLGLDPRAAVYSVYQVLTGDVAIASAIQPTAIERLNVVPARIELAGAELELVSAFSRELKLRNALAPVLGHFDYVMIDCPPSLGLLTINGLSAAREVVVPVQCEYYALEGLGQLLSNVELVRKNLNPHLVISAIIMVMFDPRTNLAGQVVDEVRRHFGDLVCRHVVPRSVRLSEAPSHGLPIALYEPDSTGALAYRALAQELVNRAPHEVTQ